MKRLIFSLAAAGVLAGCGTTSITKIGANTYYSAKANAAGAFGDPSTVAGELMANGYQHCAAMSQEFELVTKEVTQPAAGRGLGGASITFKCVAQAKDPVMRPDNGVSTIEKR